MYVVVSLCNFISTIVAGLLTVLLLLSVAGCSGKVPTEHQADKMLVTDQVPAVDSSVRHAIPEVTTAMLSLPKPAALLSGTALAEYAEAPLRNKTALYTVVADNVPIKEILYSIARDTAARVDVVGDLKGDISLSMINQPLTSILNEIARQMPVRYEVVDDHILLMEDTPFIQTYQVDYLNIQRNSESRVDLATQVGSIRTSIDGESSAQGGTNGSRLFVENKSENNLWTSLVMSIAGILSEKISPESGGSSNIFVNRESGIITVRATNAQHQSIGALLTEVVTSAQRQVLIEATVVEVTLSDRFESGVDWKVLNGGQTDGAFDYAQLLGGLPQAAEAIAPVTALLSYSNPGSVLGNLSATLKLLQQFGDVQVLSSPKIIAMNNQPAVLKVVDNRVYFTFEVDRLQRENGDERTVVDSTVHSVPVGLVMSVTPFINKFDEVILNVRPTISRILNFTEDPSPALMGQSQIRNLIPEIQVREMESLLRVQSGDVAIIGGLMQNKVDSRTTGVPGLERLPLFGKLFTHKKKEIDKTELLVFLRPTVMNRTPVEKDLGFSGSVPRHLVRGSFASTLPVIER